MPRRGVTAGIVCWVALCCFARVDRARALDPERPLTQALLRIWQVPQGLPRAAIFSLRQSDDGFLWLGTQTGLYRFDGVRFQAARDSEGNPLPAFWVRAVAEDHDHNLWLATEGDGLVRLRDGVVTRFGRAEGLPSDRVTCLLAQRDGDVWIGTDQGLVVFNAGQFTLEAVREEEIQALAEGPDGALWIASVGGRLQRWDGAKLHPLPLQQLPTRASITALHVAADETLWIGSTAGLLRCAGERERLFTTADGLSADLIQGLTPTKNGGLWVGTKDGLSRMQGERIEKFQTRDGLSQSTVFALCEDHEGSVWVGTKHGLNQLVDRRTLFPFTLNEGLPSNDTGPVLQDAAGDLWVGTLGAGLAKFDGRRFSVAATERDGLSADTILSLEDGGEDGLWIGTNAGLCRLRDGAVAERFHLKDGLPSDAIRALVRDRDGVLWAGTKAGLAALRDGQFIPPDGDEALRKATVYALARHVDTLVAATSAGLLRIVGNELTLLDGSQAAAEIDAFYVDPQHRLWSAVRGRGLQVRDGGRIIAFGVKDGLFDDDIYGLVGDDHGKLWAACSRGIFSVPFDELDRFATGELKRVTSTPFSPTDALRTIECQNGVQPAVWKMRDGCVWFSTIRGLIVIDPQRSPRVLPKPSVVIDEVRVNGQDVDPRRLAHLPPGHANFDFRYTALSFASPGRITFRYRLDGFDRDWIDAGSRREAFYTNLPPGDYRFRVQAVNLDGSQTEAARPIAFTVDPHFYQTRWFLPVTAAAIAGVGWLAYVSRVRQIKARMQAILAERSRIARELHDTLLQGFSGVTMQMQALAARLRPSSERETLHEIIHDAGGCLREARQSIAGLRSVPESESGLSAALANAARQLTEAGDVRLQLKLDSAPKLPADVEDNLVRITQEAITNALKHADATLIEVILQLSAQQLTLSIRDDGAGFDAPRHLEHAEPGHYGLLGMRERAAHIGAEIGWRSEPGRGTTVTVRRPTNGEARRTPEAATAEQAAL